MKNLSLIFIAPAIFISTNLPNVEDPSKRGRVDIQTTKDFNYMNTKNDLLKDWAGPFQGVPPLDKVIVSEFKHAL